MKSTIVLLSTLAAVTTAAVEPRSWHLPMSARPPIEQTVAERAYSQQSRLDRIKRKYNIIEEGGSRSSKSKPKRDVKGTVQMGDLLIDS